MAAWGSVDCSICGHPIRTRITRMAADPETPGVQVVGIDVEPLRVHLQACAKADPNRPSKAPAVPAADPLPSGMQAPGGTRACTMCGQPNSYCMATLRSGRVPCCAACGMGNTHPSPQESVPCSVWAAEREAKS